MMGLILAWYAFGYVWGPVFRLALTLLYPGTGYA
jgi:hypothetical protein